MVEGLVEDGKVCLCSNCFEEKLKYLGIMIFNIVEKILSLFVEDYELFEFFFEVLLFVLLVLFGKEMWKYFFLDFDNWIFINYGVFGCVFREFLEIVYKW